jgi:hypothetical protein
MSERKTAENPLREALTETAAAKEKKRRKALPEQKGRTEHKKNGVTGRIKEKKPANGLFVG